MTTIIITVLLVMISYTIKSLIDVNALLIQIKKDSVLNKTPNNLEKKYQFIKGLY
jgi:hypothetical protein